MLRVFLPWKSVGNSVEIRLSARSVRSATSELDFTQPLVEIALLATGKYQARSWGYVCLRQGLPNVHSTCAIAKKAADEWLTSDGWYLC